MIFNSEKNELIYKTEENRIQLIFSCLNRSKKKKKGNLNKESKYWGGKKEIGARGEVGKKN